MKYILGIYMLLIASMAYAACHTSSTFINGKLTVCTTCCSDTGCNTTCV